MFFGGSCQGGGGGEVVNDARRAGPLSLHHSPLHKISFGDIIFIKLQQNIMRYGGSPFGTIKLTTTAKDVHFDNARMYVTLTDEREISVPLIWFPILLHTTPEERNKWKIVQNGVGLRWEEIDEDISVKGLLGPVC